MRWQQIKMEEQRWLSIGVVSIRDRPTNQNSIVYKFTEELRRISERESQHSWSFSSWPTLSSYRACPTSLGASGTLSCVSYHPRVFSVCEVEYSQWAHLAGTSLCHHPFIVQDFPMKPQVSRMTFREAKS